MPIQTDNPQHKNESTLDEGNNVSPLDEVEEDLDLEFFLKTLESKFDGQAGNKSLRVNLGWDNDHERYWASHGRAIDRGFVTTGKGKGGSVRLADLIEDSSSDSAAQFTQDSSDYSEEPINIRERDLYDGALDVIDTGWVKSQNLDDHRVAITATMGRAETGGKWSRPDIAVLATKSFPYLPGRQFDIITFEIKPRRQTDVQGVFEALSHQQFANKAYILFHIESTVANDFAEKQPNGNRILGTARKHGVGVITSTDIADFDTWEELVPAERHTPDPEQANRFIAKCFSEDIKDWIIKLHK